ncbi:SLC13 family permease [Desulfocurvibacter africanus]|uniref:Citrate transporter n=1 Tax=Desulfocurvibacter africanus subsp. africanus str. Walvis Bay TaxID=690850 RepID=F3YVI7_DESAF|nr:SLC13 family permease [Desulfocurvibacter africanus]EGJ48723.1 Citrate transporter [Desulfocurvibacter africanus subsp. africanus str. Walvis Bay]
MHSLVLAVFVVVYLGMALGRLPWLALDRTGVAVLGAIALMAGGALTAREAWLSVDVPTMAMLFGLMVVSAQLRLGGFYTRVTRAIAAADLPPQGLLGLVIAASALLSALLANDIICLAMTPILVEGCRERNLKPMPFLLALACASNIGSAATLIGNPQNMLIGQITGLSFTAYLLDAAVPVAASLAALWVIVCLVFRDDWDESWHEGAAGVGTPTQAPAFNAWQTGKGLFFLGILMAVFLAGVPPREVAALGCAGVLLLSRKLASRDKFALVDWPLLLLFLGLFVVNHALAATGILDFVYASAERAGIDLNHGGWLFAATAVLSNIVSNVPAVMLLLPKAMAPESALVLALSSTLAGNLLLVGSIANLIVADQAERFGVRVTWGAHLRVGLPVTLTSFALTGLWLWLRWGEHFVGQ